MLVNIPSVYYFVVRADGTAVLVSVEHAVEMKGAAVDMSDSTAQPYNIY